MNNQLMELISKNNIDTAVSLIEKLNLVNNSQLVSLKNQYNQLNNDKMMGLLSNDDSVLRQNRFVSLLIKIAEISPDKNIVNSSIQAKLDHLLEAQESNENQLSEIRNSQSILLSQLVENHEQLFESRSEQRVFINKLEEVIEINNILPELPDDWYDRPVKDKIKISIPFIVGKWERELDITDAKLDWKSFKNIFLKG